MSGNGSRAPGFYDAPPAAPAPSARPDPRDALGGVASRLYGEAVAPAAKPEAEPVSSRGVVQPKDDDERRDEFGRAAQNLYGARVETRGLVEWKEAPASDVKALSLDNVPANLRAGTPEEFQAVSARFREGLVAAGAGPSIANEVWRDAITAAQEPIRTTVAEAEATLREKWGPAYKQNLAAAKGLIARATAVCPEIKTVLAQTGLQNSPVLAMKLAKWAQEHRKVRGR